MLFRSKESRFQVKPISTGIKAVDKMALMEVMWYGRQLRRMGNGKAPKPNESGLKAFLGSMITNEVGSFKTRRLRA